MTWAQLGQRGGIGAHLLKRSLRIDKAVLEPRSGAVPGLSEGR